MILRLSSVTIKSFMSACLYNQTVYSYHLIRIISSLSIYKTNQVKYALIISTIFIYHILKQASCLKVS